VEPERLVERCSTIFIAAGDRIQVFHSLEQVPDKLREKLLESTRGPCAATILIADEQGRREILRAAESSQPAFDRRWAALLAAQPAVDGSRLRPSIRGAARLLLGAAAVACLIWAALAWRG